MIRRLSMMLARRKLTEIVERTRNSPEVQSFVKHRAAALKATRQA